MDFPENNMSVAHSKSREAFLNNDYEGRQISILLDTKELKTEIYNFLKGIVYDPKTDEYTEKNPMLNEQGVHTIMETVSGYINKITFLSNLDENTIKFQVKTIGEAVNQLLYCKGEDYELDIAHHLILVNTIQDIISAALHRARDGGERDFLGRTQHESSHTIQTEKPRGMGGLFKR